MSGLQASSDKRERYTVRKQELIHLHALLALARRHLEECEDIEIPPDGFEAYDCQDVAPTAIDARKHRHRQAVVRLLDGFDAVSQSQQVTEPVSTRDV